MENICFLCPLSLPTLFLPYSNKKNMNNILTVITVHTIKSDTTHQLSRKWQERKTGWFLQLDVSLRRVCNWGCPPLTLLNGTDPSLEYPFFAACTVIYFPPSQSIHWAGFPDFHLNLSCPMHEGHHSSKWVPKAFPIDKWDLGRIMNVETGEIRGHLLKEQAGADHTFPYRNLFHITKRLQVEIIFPGCTICGENIPS